MQAQTGISDKITELDLLSFCLGLSFAHIELSLSHATFKFINQSDVRFSLCKYFSIFLLIFYFLKKKVKSPECAQALGSV